MSRLIQLFSILMLATLAGCGGPTGGDGTQNLTTNTGLNLQIYAVSSGDQTTTIQDDDAGRLEILVLDQAGARVENEIVTLNVTLGSSELSQTTVLTDSEGRANVRVYSPTLPLNTTDPGRISAVSDNYETEELIFQFVSSNSTGDSTPELEVEMSLTSTGVVTTDIPVVDSALVTVTLTDGDGNPLVNELINLNATVGQLSQNLLKTDSDGQSRVTIEPPEDLTQGTAPGSVTVTPESGAAEPQSINYQFIATENSGGDTSSVGSISFLSATPTIISLKGTGGTGYSEVSEVEFLVSNTDGSPMQGQTVNFTLTTTVGGLSLTSDSAISATDGTVTAFVNSGTIATPVRVTASVTLPDGSPVFVQSDQLTLTTGIPDQNSVSLSFSEFAPEGLNIDGTEITVTARLADRFNNPVPNGTVVNFTTEGGSIDGSCVTADSACSVTWTSQNPRPADHRSTILATVIGHETYYDKNGSGIFDDDDSFDDLPEAYRNDDELNGFDPDAYNFADTGGSYNFSEDEKFIDYDGSADYSVADGLYNGVPCEHTTLCAPDSNNLAGSSNLLTTLSDSGVIVMASSSPNITIRQTTSGSCLDSNGKLKTDGTCTTGGVAFGTGAQSVAIWILIEDSAALCRDSSGSRVDSINPSDAACQVVTRQSAPTGSSISVTSDVGTVSTVPVTTVDNKPTNYYTSSHDEFIVILSSSAENEDDAIGGFTVKVTSPSGVETGTSFTVFDPAN